MAFNYSQFQIPELSPEEQAAVPMLTNIPETAESAWGRGQDVYFLSDRPETEQFIAEKMPERPYKKVLRDLRSMRPSEDQMLLSEARRDFGANEGAKMLGFDPNNPPNPGEIAQTARNKYFNLASPDQIQSWDEKTRKLHYSEAEKWGKAAYQEALGKVNAAKNVMSMFDKSWTERQKQIRMAQEPSKESLVPVQEGDKIVYRRRTAAVGAQVPPGGVVAVQDEEGNVTYQLRAEAVGKTPAPREKTEKKWEKTSYVGWDKEGKEVVKRVDTGDEETQSDLIGKGYVEKSKFDRMDTVDRKLAQREAMKRIGGKMSKYRDAVEVRMDYKRGKIKKEEALKILREDFGMTK